MNGDPLAVVRIQRDKMIFDCPGCGCAHWFSITPPHTWTWNGDVRRPTVSPSIDVRGHIHCHSFITDGSIRFLTDCDHELAGQTVPLTPL